MWIKYYLKRALWAQFNRFVQLNRLIKQKLPVDEQLVNIEADDTNRSFAGPENTIYQGDIIEPIHFRFKR